MPKHYSKRKSDSRIQILKNQHWCLSIIERGKLTLETPSCSLKLFVPSWPLVERRGFLVAGPLEDVPPYEVSTRSLPSMPTLGRDEVFPGKSSPSSSSPSWLKRNTYHYSHSTEGPEWIKCGILRRQQSQSVADSHTLVHARDSEGLMVGSEVVHVYPDLEAVCLTNYICNKRRWLSLL